MPTRRRVARHLRTFRRQKDRAEPGWRRAWREMLDRERPSWEVATVLVVGGRRPWEMVVLCRGGFEGERIEGFDPDAW